MLDIFKLVSFLLRISRAIQGSRQKLAVAIVAGILSGASYPALLAVINSALASGPGPQLLYAFVGLCLVGPTTRLVSQGLFDVVGAGAIFDIRMQLCRRILGSYLRHLEQLGEHRLLASLTADVTSLATAFVQIPAMIMHVAIALACLAYMAWLSPSLFLVIVSFLAIGLLTLRLPVSQSNRYFSQLRDKTDTMFAQFRGLIYGAKELKLNHQRSAAFLASEVIPTGRDIQRLSFFGNTVASAAVMWGNLLFFAAIGLLFFRLTDGQADGKVLAGYVLAMLYLKTPVEVLLQAIPGLSRATAALARLEELGLQLEAQAMEPEAPLSGREPTWRSLELVGVKHAYHGEDGQNGFAIGPVSLAFHPGEVVFIVGGNGSGKTTLAKVLTGLYRPEDGEIRLDGKVITDESRDSYRQLFSAVFADFYLFNNLSGLGEGDSDAKANAYLARLQLEEKVKIQGGGLSTQDLSQGQRKRLALLAAYLEDRPIYFFDEWASDQDPQYKAIFYLEILSELKARAKTVFVISHDDHYYHVADRIIKLNYGQVEADLSLLNARPESLQAR